MAECSNTSDQLPAMLVTGSDAIADLVCDLCSEDGLYVEVEGFCVDCGDYLCQECVKGHKRNRMSKNHVLQDKSQMPREKQNVASESSNDMCSEPCEHHSGRIVEYYCHDHGSLGCSVCITMTHRQCINVDHIPDQATDLLNSQVCKQFQEDISTLRITCKEIAVVTKANKSMAEKLCSKVTTSMKKLREDMNMAFDKMEEEIGSQAESLKSEDIENLTALSEKGNTVLTELEDITSDLDSLEGNNQLCQLFIKMITTQNRLGSLFSMTDHIENNYSVRKYSFAPSSDMQHILNGTSSIGLINVHNPTQRRLSSETSSPSAGNAHVVNGASNIYFDSFTSLTQDSNEVHEQVSVQDVSANPSSVLANDQAKSKILHLKNMYVRTAKDKLFVNCVSKSSTLISENKLILIDDYSNKVKLMDLESGVVTSELSLKSVPYAATSVSSSEVAVTFPDKKIIMFVKATDVLVKDREIPAGGECLGIVYGNGKLITSYRNPPHIAILSLAGILESTVSSSNDGNGLFKFPHHLALSPDGETIYVSDKGDSSVKSIALNGTVKAVYNDSSLKQLGGIAVDKFGQVIVCEQVLKQLHLLSPDCKKIKVLVDKLPWVRSVCYCPTSAKLYVTFIGNYIKVYQLY